MEGIIGEHFILLGLDGYWLPQTANTMLITRSPTLISRRYIIRFLQAWIWEESVALQHPGCEFYSLFLLLPSATGNRRAQSVLLVRTCVSWYPFGGISSPPIRQLLQNWYCQFLLYVKLTWRHEPNLHQWQNISRHYLRLIIKIKGLGLMGADRYYFYTTRGPGVLCFPFNIYIQGAVRGSD